MSADPMVNASPAADFGWGVMGLTMIFFGASLGCDSARDEFPFKATILSKKRLST